MQAWAMDAHALVVVRQVGVLLLGVNAAVVNDVIHSALKVSALTAQVIPGSCAHQNIIQ